MSCKAGRPFDSIESAHEFVVLLAETVREAKRDVEADVQRESGSQFPRRLDALRTALYSMERLELHMNKSRRILNDLRSLRRLLLGERANGTTAVQLVSTGTAGASRSPSRPSPRGSRPVVDESAVARDMSTCVIVKRRALSSAPAADGHNPRMGDALPWYVRQDVKLIDRTATVKTSQ